MKTRANEPHRRWNRSLLCVPLTLFLAFALTGCIHEPQLLPLSRQKLIDRSLVEYPAGCSFVQLIKGLNCPTAMCWDSDGNMLFAESGIDGSEPHIFGFHKDNSYFNIYPWKRTVSFYPTGFVLYGPIGGMAAYNGKIYVSHRDRNDKGVITALGYDGTHSTIVADLPAQGDYGVTDVVINGGRVYFGVGTATNSGVVGLDNFAEGWAKRHPEAHDEVYSPPPNDTPWKLLGFRFDTPNPFAGLGNGDLSVTGPFQAFGHSNQSRIRPTDKPNGAIYSVSVDGGPAKVEAYGFHNPRGIAFDQYGRVFLTTDGMQTRGTRPIVDDPDTLVHMVREGWHGFPDFSTDFHPISDEKYRPPVSMLIQSGYPEVSPLLNADASGLHLPDSPQLLVYGIFPSLSGAGKMDFIPSTGPFKELQGNIVVALDGDRAPFATNGLKLLGRQGFKIALVDMDNRQVKDFVRNTAGVPVSMQPFGTIGLERPIDVKVGPDGAIYILDFGRMENNSAIPRYYPGTGGLFRLNSIEPTPASTP
jgi:glucose/arabinose dehydrogenase